MVQLVDTIFGGPPPDLKELADYFAECGIRFPTKIRAFAERPPAKSRVDSQVLMLHPGLGFQFSPAKPSPGDQTIADSPASAIRALQQAVLVERRRELRELVSAERGEASLESEIQAFHIAAQHLREGQQELPEAVEIWLQIVLSRHQEKMHTVRRKFIEFYSQITRGVDADISYLFHTAIQRTLNAFGFKQLVVEFRRSVMELRAVVAGRNAFRPLDPASHSPPVQRTFRFMEKNFTETIGLKEVAKSVFVSAPHLARQFKSETGRTVVEYLQLLRINRARELLSSSDLGILEVSLSAGFPSVEHFHRIFRRETGMTPRRYRLMSRGK